MAFYHILADRNDTASAFGAERPFRYGVYWLLFPSIIFFLCSNQHSHLFLLVCAENLEECRDYSTSLETSIDDMEGWEMDTGSSIERYIPPDDVKVRPFSKLL